MVDDCECMIKMRVVFEDFDNLGVFYFLYGVVYGLGVFMVFFVDFGGLLYDYMMCLLMVDVWWFDGDEYFLFIGLSFVFGSIGFNFLNLFSLFDIFFLLLLILIDCYGYLSYMLLGFLSGGLRILNLFVW